ncbi:hypothetical protein BKA93DRAFT_745141, partial [Sparassis latifolia]
TDREWELQAALHEAADRDEARKKHMIGMQATVVLQDLYVNKAQTQLQAQEEKSKKLSKKKLFGDRLLKLLTSDGFVNEVVALEERQQQEAAAKVQRAAQHAAHTGVLAKWKAEDTARIRRNDTRRSEHQRAVKVWE